MAKEQEQGKIHQYCLSILNSKLVADNSARFGLDAIFGDKLHPVFSTNLPAEAVTFFEEWLANTLSSHKIEYESLMLDYLGRNVLNYAVFADNRLKIKDRLKKLPGFRGVNEYSKYQKPRK